MLTTDPLKVAADDMVRAAEQYRAAVWALGAEVGVECPYPNAGEIRVRSTCNR